MGARALSKSALQKDIETSDMTDFGLWTRSHKFGRLPDGLILRILHIFIA